MSKALTIDVQALHEWALENEFDPNHYSLNKLIELYDLSKQLKAQDINIQENKNIISKTLYFSNSTHLLYKICSVLDELVQAG